MKCYKLLGSCGKQEVLFGYAKLSSSAQMHSIVVCKWCINKKAAPEEVLLSSII